jgi:hypothetical protein
MTAIFIATIGTRDLMLQVSSELWYSIGNDRLNSNTTLVEQLEVIWDTKLSETSTYREITKLFADNKDKYIDRINPVIIGQLIADKAAEIKKIYLIGTNQPESTGSYRDRDSIYSCELIKAWAEKKYGIETTCLYIGEEGTNPSSFEEMFQWWREAWRNKIQPSPQDKIWLSLKGGVGQTSEAGRIAGLNLYEKQIEFFEFQETPEKNRIGIPSDYTGPFTATNYLWERTQQQVQQMIDRYDYDGAKALLSPYFDAPIQPLGEIPGLLTAGVYWNQGQFQSFRTALEDTIVLPPAQKRQLQSWWWMAYEQAYLAVVRLQQNNTAEAMLHSFRAIEGCLLEWAKYTLGEDFQDRPEKFPLVKPSIVNYYPSLKSNYEKARSHGHGQYTDAQWSGALRRQILETVLPAANNYEFQIFWDSQDTRNILSHRLGGLSEKDIMSAWGIKIPTYQDQGKAKLEARSHWQKRIVACLNILTDQPFKNLEQASLFAKMQIQVRGAIEQL